METINLTDKTKDELIGLAEITTALKKKYKERFIDFVFPATGRFSRDAYVKAMRFFAAGKQYRFRMFGGSNGSGKSFTGATELTYHLTGEYPEWWPGIRQERPLHWWIVCESGGTFKSSLQRTLLGPSLNDEDLGTGLIPKDAIIKVNGWPNIAGAVVSFEVRHKLGHTVTVEVKTSDQKVENIQAANLDGVFEDEEPPMATHTECLMRLRGSPTKPPGILMLMYTPMKGITDLTLSFLADGLYPNDGNGGECPNDPDKYTICIDMEEVPHLSETDKRAYRNNTPPHEVEARLHGRPGLGSGKVYPIAESDVFVKPFPIPPYWPRCFTLDFGWVCTAVLWAAKDPATNVIYCYAEYYKGEQSAQIHSFNILERGRWIPGICDPAGGKTRETSGEFLADVYRRHGLNLTLGSNDSAGIQRVFDALQNGTLKFFDTLVNLKKEFATYRYDTKEPNKPAAGQKDHLMDDIKYMLSRFDWVAKTQEEVEEAPADDRSSKRKTDPSGY